MIKWIVTIGNSDIQLKTLDNWLNFCDGIWDKLYDNIIEPSKIEDTDYYNVPARVLGLVYENHIEENYQDLYFPLLSGFCDYLDENRLIPDEIVYLISDQSTIFKDNERSLTKCPYWKDSCTLKPILEYYFKQRFPNTKLTPLLLNPEQDGLHNWDTTLTLLQEKLETLKFNKNQEIYVSHQAGTPAISSALQFISLAKFGDQVKFLVSDEYKNQVTTLSSSKYLRGIQIEQAKGLVSNSPGAAQKLITKNNINLSQEISNQLNELVNFFNLNRTNDNEDEFSIENATQRIVDALDLIGILFNQQNYLQGISLLSAANETFTKVAIIQSISNLDININGTNFKGYELIQWTNEGLGRTNLFQNKSVTEQNEGLKKLKFPVDRFPIPSENNQYFNKTNNNSVMLKWLLELEPRFKPWPVLEWSFDYYRERENDIRNQLMHNLRGTTEKEVKEYLLGYESSDLEKIMDVYNQKVKTPFLNMIILFNLPYKRDKLNERLNNLANSLI